MTDRPATGVPGTAQVPAAGLEPDAIGVSQDTVVGMANAAPAVSVGGRVPRLGAHVRRALRPAVTVLPDPEGERHRGHAEISLTTGGA